MLLTKKKRQEYLKYLGYYTGAIDGKIGPKTKEAYLKLQKDYFFNKKDMDGIYGKNTDILLRNAYLVKKYTKNFDLKDELSCKCDGKHCTGYPAIYNEYALKYLQDVRDEYGAVTIESSLRCKTHNKNVGGTSTSKHMKGKAFDIRNSKICKSDSAKKAFVDKYIKKDKASYAYYNGYGRTKYRTSYPKAPGMGRSVHIDVK